MKNIRVMIADDEPLARQGVADMLMSKDDVDIVAEVDNGIDAIEILKSEQIDLVFLDVQMPGKTGIEVIQEVGPANMPEVIFVTAYDQYAIKAFDYAAIDYLLKPYDEERFNAACERVLQKIALSELGEIKDQLAGLLQFTGAADNSPNKTTSYLERISAESRGVIRVLSVNDIDFIRADGPYAELWLNGEKFLIRERMHTLESRLDPAHFFRIHRSTIVQLNRIDSILLKAGGDYGILLKNGERLKLGRGRKEELEKRLGLNSL